MAAALASLSAVGCSGEQTPFVVDSGGGGGSGGSGGSAPLTCESGQIAGPDGECMAVGIQGCADLFIEDDGLCHPALAKCPAGTIPKFDEGCVPVGIQGCPEVFMEDDGLCHPSMDKCPAGTFAAPLLGCVPIDGSDGCGSGTWGNIDDGPNTVWVDPEYTAGDGDGTQAKPLTTIADALALVPDGGRIALAAGSYVEPMWITRPVEIVGRCPSLVTISGTQAAPYGDPYFGQNHEAIVVVEATDGVSLRQVSLSGLGRGVIVASAAMSLMGVHIHHVSNTGIFACNGADVIIDRCLVEHTLPDPVDFKGAPGLNVRQDAQVTVTNSAFYQTLQMGVRAVDDSQITAMGILVQETEYEPAADYYEFGVGLAATAGGMIDASASALIGNWMRAASVEKLGTTMVLSDCLIEGTLTESAVVALAMAEVRVSRCAIVNNLRSGMVATGAWGEARGNLVRNNRALGVRATAQAFVALVDNAVVENRGPGISVEEPTAGMVIEGNLIEGNGVPHAKAYGMDGLRIDLATDVAVHGNAVVDNVGNGLRLASATASVEHNLVAGTMGTTGCPDRRGEGITILGAEALVELDENAVLYNHSRGLWGSAGAEISLERCLIAHTQPRAADGELGCGAVLEGRTTASVDQVIVTDNHLAALLIQDSSAAISSSRFEATNQGSFTSLLCPVPPCPWNQETVHQGIADGIIAAASTLQLSGVSVAGCSRAGVLFHESDGLLGEVISTHNGFGLVLQGTSRPVVADDCTFTPNDEQDVLADSELAIPNASSDLPEGP